MRTRASLVAVLFVVGGCVKNISNEERLDRESPSGDVAALNHQQLSQVNCNDAEARLGEVRQGNRPEVERLAAYMELYQTIQQRTDVLDAAMRRDQDLLYIPEFRPILDAHAACFEHSNELRVEFERFTRELVEVPTVQEIQKGKTMLVPRVDFTVLRNAIEAIDPSDKAELYSQLVIAERRLESAEPIPTASPRRR